MTANKTFHTNAGDNDNRDQQNFSAQNSTGNGSTANLEQDAVYEAIVVPAEEISDEPVSDPQSADTPSRASTMVSSLESALGQLSAPRRVSVTLPKSMGKRAFEIANRMAQATTLDNLYQITVTDLRKRFGCDRAFIYRFQSPGEGTVIAESVTAGYTPALGESLSAIAFGASHAHDYQTQSVIALANANEEAASPHQMQLLKRFQVQASLSLPVFAEDQIWGLLVVQQCANTRAWEKSDIGLLYQVSTELTLKLQAYELHQQHQSEIARGEALGTIIRTIRGFTDIQEIFESTTKSVRSFLKADRVAVFQFTPDSDYSTGAVVVESVNPNFVAAKEIEVDDHCFSDRMAEAYRRGRVSTISDIYQPGISECYIDVLAQFQVRANLVVPLLKNNQLWGLFCIHQCSAPRQWQDVETAFVKRVAGQLDLAMQQADYLAQVQEKTKALEALVEKEQLITKMTERLRHTMDVTRTLKPVVQDIRKLMKADRVGLYQFDVANNYSVGEFVVEDVAVGVRSAMAAKIQDHCFAEDHAENYQNGRYWVVNDVKTLDLPDCLTDLLDELQVTASIVVPLLKGDILWGLFAIHQCTGPREWQESDVQFAHRLGAQFNLALQQADYLTQVQQKTTELTETAEREKTSKEQLQQQVIALLQAVGPALQGDLTVRAQVTDTEVGTVASTYNTTLQSLQKIVLQVQDAANQVGETSKRSETSAVTVTQQAQHQAQALENALTLVQTMVDSTAAVAKDAQQVEAAAQQANQIVQTGDTAMNRTVDGIMAIRATVAETNQRIKRLSESSQKVSKIVSLISHFTTQTQLLALNASIEATRAGQYGRGFAVVADEVRSLARQSAEAATEIEQFVQEIQMGTAEVSTAMETGIQQVAEGTQMVTDARHNLTAIVEATDQISQRIADITQTTHQQADEFKVVTTTMTDATEIANQTAENANALTQAIQQVLGTAEALQVSTGQFKVD
ncbi:MAG: GAF domain-containing protein [Cyanobacteria bacterium P01_F01_bin.53]